VRQAFVKTISELMQGDDSIMLLTADTGFHVFDEFQNVFPDRYLNVGISEAAMIGMAAGLAIDGKQVFVYGIAPFVTMRCFEQIRVCLCYPNLPVRIVGVGAGLTYGPAGMTHHSIEDIAVMSCLPNMAVVCPGDPVEVREAVRASVGLPGPCYLRLGKTGEPTIHTAGIEAFAIGRGIRIAEGSGIGIVAVGNMLETAVGVHQRLKDEGMDPELVSMHTVKPIDRDLILDLADRCHTIATIEEHSVIGGLAGTVAGVVTGEGRTVRLQTFALPDQYEHYAGSQAFIRSRCGLTVEAIASRLLECANGAGRSGSG